MSGLGRERVEHRVTPLELFFDVPAILAWRRLMETSGAEQSRLARDA